MLQRYFDLNLNAGESSTLVINANQYDHSEEWIFTLYSNGELYKPSQASIVGIKSDKLGIINSASVNSDGQVVVSETKQMTASSGDNIFELQLDSEVHGTHNFIVRVEPKPADNANFSDSDISLMEQAIESATTTNDNVASAKASAEQAKTSEENASASASASATSEANAKTSEENAKTSETNAKESETNAKNSADSISNIASQVETNTNDIAQIKEDLGDNTDLNALKEQVEKNTTNIQTNTDNIESITTNINNPSIITNPSNIKEVYVNDGNGLKGIALDDMLLTNPDLYDKGGYIGRKVEGGGTIFFDYAIGYKYGSLSVAPITTNLHTYHVDLATGMVVCDDPSDTTKQNRFYVVNDEDIGDLKHGDCLAWATTDLTTMYNVSLGTETGFGKGLSNTQKCITAATSGGAIERNSSAYKNIWHYLWEGDYQYRSPKWFAPSKDELNVLLNMQWQDSARRKGYNGESLRQLPINFYAYYWSSSEQSVTIAYSAYFFSGVMSTNSKNNASSNHVRLCKTF